MTKTLGNRALGNRALGPVSVTFLGGLGDVGRNCTVVESGGELLVIDFGVMFGDPAVTPGVNQILPDMTWLASRAEDIAGVVLTHGHEDHLGGVPHLLRRIEATRPIPLYGSALTMALAEHKVREERLESRTSFNVLTDGERLRIGAFDVEVLPITHSVPQSLCVVLHTPAGALVHTGDFKIDPKPIDGRLTDLGRLRELSKRSKRGKGGIALLMADSTNADRPGRSASESEIGPVLAQIFDERPHRGLVVSCFASHLHRVQQICDAATAAGRVIIPLGRSMVNNVRIARELGVLRLAERNLLSAEHLSGDWAGLAPSEVCVICTGSQGEPNAALALIASGSHAELSVGADDTVVLSSHPIPGNERAVFRMVSQLTRRGVEVIHSGHAKVHTSGHAQRDELAELHKACRPRWFVPIEGEHHMLARHAGLARELGMAPQRVLTLTDGARVRLDADGLRVADGVPAPYHYVDGSIEDGTDSAEVMAERIALRAGYVHVTVVLAANKGDARLAAQPAVATRGWLGADQHSEVIEGLCEEVAAAVNRALEKPKRGSEPADIERVARRAAGRFVGGRTKRRPAISAEVISLAD